MSLSKLHVKSSETPIPQLELFSVPTTQMSLKSGRYIPYNGLDNSKKNNPIGGGGTIVFDMGTTNNFRDFNDSRLHLQIRIINHDGTKLGPDQVAAFVNYPIRSIFSHIEVEVGGNVITFNNGTDSFKSLIIQLLSENRDGKETRLQCGGYYKDDAGLHDSIDIDGAKVNSGFLKRFNLCKESKVVDLIGEIQTDFFATGRYVPGELKVKLTLTRNKDSFCIMGDRNDYQIEIVSAVFYVRELDVSSSIQMARQDAWNSQPLRFPIKKIETKSFTVVPNMPYIKVDIGNGNDSHLPKFLAIMLVEKIAYHPYNSIAGL